ncbi:MAG: hypothetical protein ACK57J_20835, partial [Rubrivivax sp.]
GLALALTLGFTPGRPAQALAPGHSGPHSREGARARPNATASRTRTGRRRPPPLAVGGAIAPDGSLVAMWRHVFAPNERDHDFAPVRPVTAAEAANPARATQDRWAIDACPHHGPGLAPAASGGYHAVWFGEKAGQAAVRYGRLSADGLPVGAVRALPDAAAEHAAVASAGRTVAITWRAFDGKAMRWRAWLSTDDGASFTPRELGHSSTDTDHPLLLQRGERIVALWRTTEGVRLERLAP